MTAKHGLWAFYQGHKHFLAPTPLNLRTSARYDACNGAHKASGQTVKRDFGDRQLVLPICRRCGCPYNFPKITSSRARWNGVSDGR